MVKVELLGLEALGDPMVLPPVIKRSTAWKNENQETHLDKDRFSSVVDPSERMTSICREVVPVGRGVIRQEHHTSMLTLGDVGEEVKPGVKVEQETLGISLLRSNVVGTLEGVSDEEDGEVKAYEIVVPVFSVELGSVASGVSSRVGVLSLIVSQ